MSLVLDMTFMATLLQCVVQQHAWLDDGVMSFLLVPVEESCRCSKCRSFTKEPVWEKSVPAVHTHVEREDKEEEGRMGHRWLQYL